MSSVSLGLTREDDHYYVVNIIENYKAKVVQWFKTLGERISTTLKAGNSIVVIGPHGVGKSVLTRYITAKFIEEQYAVIDVSTDVVTFDNALEVLNELPNALGFYDPLGITFYDSSRVLRSETALTLRDRCDYIADRVLYLRYRDVPSLITLPTELYRYTTCMDYIADVKVVNVAEYLKTVDLAAVLREVFASHASGLGCREAEADSYISYVLERHGDYSGVFPLTVYGAKRYAKNRCLHEPPDVMYREVVRELSRIYQDLYRRLFLEKWDEIRPSLSLSLSDIHLPIDVARLLPKIRRVERVIAFLQTPDTEYTKLLREEALDQLREMYHIENGDVAFRWATAPKESIVKEVFKEFKYPCRELVEKIRVIYRGLFIAYPEMVFEFAKAIAKFAYGENRAREMWLDTYVTWTQSPRWW